MSETDKPALYFDQKMERARQLLDRTRLWRWNHSPPLYRVLWRVGLRVRPPHFASFWVSLVSNAAWFGLFFGVIMWFFVWWPKGTPANEAAKALLIGALLFGLLMAGFYAIGRTVHLLPRWEEL